MEEGWAQGDVEPGYLVGFIGDDVEEEGNCEGVVVSGECVREDQFPVDGRQGWALSGCCVSSDGYYSLLVELTLF